MKYNQSFKFFLTILLIGIFVTGFSTKAYSQCEPDLVNCLDDGEPGQMCPAVLPDGFVEVYYEQVITVLTPESGNVGSLNINIHKLKLESVENLPEGMEYESTTDEFYANEAYCISLKGTPKEEGTYKLKITVSPFIMIFGIPVKWGEHVDSTSIVMKIAHSNYVDPRENQDFTLINAFPNPFSTGTKIGFNESLGGEVDLRVFNMLGGEVHLERIMSTVGENYFDFSGSSLMPGYYLYAIVREDKVLNGRLIKNK